MNAFDELTTNFSRLPGIGKKSAIRMVNWLLKQDAVYVQKFAQNIATLQEKIKPCAVCYYGCNLHCIPYHGNHRA